MVDVYKMRSIRRHVGTVLLLVFVLLVLGGYVLYPSLRVVWESLHDQEVFSLRHYRTFFSLEEGAHVEALLHSLYISAGSVVLSALVGVVLAFVFTRYEFPGRSIFAALAIFPIALPPLVGVISFYFLYGESGMIPRGLQEILGLDQVPFALDGVPAIFLVHAYTMYVYFYLFVSAALSRMDPSALEAAANLGGSRFFVFWRVTLPLLTPALVGAALLVFMTSMASFSAPLLYAGGYRVLSLQIYFSKLNGDMEMAVTQTVVLSAFSILFLLVLRWYSGRRRYQMAGKGTGVHRRTIRGGKMRFVAGALGIVGVIVLMLPHLTIVLLSFVQDGTWTWQVLPPSYTVENYLRLFRDPRVLEPILNSLKMAGLATSGNLIFGVLAAYLLARRAFPGKSGVEVLVMLPWALPGTVVAINLIAAFNQGTVFSAGQVLVSTFWILPLAYFVRHIPLVVRSSYAALEQFDSTLEEAARNLGASWGRAFRRVVLPAILPGVFAGTLIAFVSALGEFVSSILLYIYDNRPISVEILSQLRLFNFGSAAAYGVFLIVLISATLLFSHKVLGVRSQRAFV